VTGRTDSESYMNMTRRWFTEGWAGNIALADDIFSENVRTNGVAVGWPGLNAGYRKGWPASRTSRQISSICSQRTIKSLRGSFGGTHTGSYGGIKASGKQVAVPDFAVWRFEGGKVVETSTLQDQFSLLKQIGYPHDEVYAA
jgi:predicted ester cyclase